MFLSLWFHLTCQSTPVHWTGLPWASADWGCVSAPQLSLWTGGTHPPTVWLHVWRSETCLTQSCEYLSRLLVWCQEFPHFFFSLSWLPVCNVCVCVLSGRSGRTGISPSTRPSWRSAMTTTVSSTSLLTRTPERYALSCEWWCHTSVLLAAVMSHCASCSLHRAVSMWSVSLQSTQGEPSRHFMAPGLMVSYTLNNTFRTQQQ